MGFNPGGGGGISAASDVALSSPTNNQVLTYDGTSAKWKNKAVTASGGGISLPQFNVETYGAVGDGTTDDYTAIKAAWDAMVASPVGGIVVFPRIAVYRVDATVAGRLQHTSDLAYALFPIPNVVSDTSHKKLTIGFQGVGDPCSPRAYANGGVAPVMTSSVLQVEYSTPFTWSSSYGLPSIIGGPDADTNGEHFTNLHFVGDGLTFRQPQNPSLCALNLESLTTATLGSVGFDVIGILDTSPEPTHPTGASLLMPMWNNNVTARIERSYAWGYYTGPCPFTEHLDVGSAIVVRCKIAAPIRRGGYHFAHTSMLSAEQCPWIISGYNPAGAGANDGVVSLSTIEAGDPVWKFDFVDIEDTSYASQYPWMYAPNVGAHVYDPSSRLRGQMHFARNDVDGGLITGRPVVNGASQFGIYSMYNAGDAATRINTTNAPGTTPPPGSTAPDAPTIGTATPHNASASVTFTAPASNGGSAITGYTVTSNPGSHTGTGSSSPVTVSGLTNGTAYTFTVTATNAIGTSIASAASNSVTPSAGSVVTYATDTFTRADSSAPGLGTADTGQVWHDTHPAWFINSNSAYTNTTSGSDWMPAWIDVGQTEVTVEADMGFNASTDGGVAARVTDENNMIWMDVSSLGGPQSYGANIFARVGGTFHALGTLTNITKADGTYHIKLVCTGTSISAYVDGTQVGTTVTDTYGLTGTGAGFSRNGGVATRIDNFSVTNI